jgi:hypothetical protein
MGSMSFAQDTNSSGFKFDAGAGLSFGIMKDDVTEEDPLAGIATFLATLRGALYGTARYAFTDNLSAGVQIGVYAITYSSGDESTTLIDIPARALARFQAGPLAVEAFGGYYLSMIKTDNYNFSGFETGAKLLLGPVYGSYSIVFADPTYNRVEVGIQLSDLLKKK